MFYWMTVEHGVVFRPAVEGFLGRALVGPRPVPVESQCALSTERSLLIDMPAVRRAAAHIFQLGWEATERGERVPRDLVDLDADELTLECIQKLRALREQGNEEARRLLFALCRLRREGQMAFLSTRQAAA